MKRLKGTKYYDTSGVEADLASMPKKTGYLLQKTIRCSICKKKDTFAQTNPNQMPHLISDSYGVYILDSEVFIRGDSWYYTPDLEAHDRCREVYELGLYI